MHNLVKNISFIIWTIYYILLTNREIARKNMNKDKYTWNLLTKDIFYLFRLDSFFFLIMFYIYKGFNNDSVTYYLYFVFMVSSLVFILYDLQDKYNIKKNKVKKEKRYYFASFILYLIPGIYYFLKKDIPTVCLWTFAVNFFLPIAIFLTKVLSDILKKK